MVDEYPEISGITNAREAMKKMPEPDRAKIAEQVSSFRYFLSSYSLIFVDHASAFFII